MQSDDDVIQRAVQDIHDLLLVNIAPTRNLSDERTLLCIHSVVKKESVRQALEKAADTVLCFALREVKHVLDQRQTPPTTINRLQGVIESLARRFGTGQSLKMLL